MNILIESTTIIPQHIYEQVLTHFVYPNYQKSSNILYHNTKLNNVESILKNGLLVDKSTQLEYEGNMIWATSLTNQKGYGGVTIAFSTQKIKNMEQVNNSEYCIYENIPVSEILFIDLPVCGQPHGQIYRLSDIPRLVEKVGKEKVIQVSEKMPYQYIPIETVISYM